MSSTTLLKDASTRHSIFVQRFAGGQIKELQVHIDRLMRDVRKRIMKHKGQTLTKARLEALYRDLAILSNETYKALGKDLKKNMQEFGEYETDFSARMFTKNAEATFAAVSAQTLEAALLKTTLEVTPGSSLTIDKALNRFSKEKAAQLVQAVKDGVVIGKPIEEIVNDVGMLTRGLQRAQTAALIRTITNHVSNVARDITIEGNRDLVKGVIWVSTLDSRTSGTCRSLDGKTFKVGKGPRPPLHWSCRSTVIPVVRKRFNLGKASERPAIGSSGVTTVQGQTTYNSWLKKQSVEFQNEVLGKSRGALFRKGNLSMDKFVDSNFQDYTLKQLKRRESLAFEKAGLE